MSIIKKIISLLLVFVFGVLLSSASNYKYETVAGDPMHAQIYTLQNGLKVYLSVNKEKPRVTAYIAVNTGHRNDPADCTGLAHYLEHLMFKGSHRLGTSNYLAEKPLIDKISQLYEEYRQLTDPSARKAKYHEIDSVSQLAAQYNIPNEYDKVMAAIGSEGSNAHTWYDETIYKEDIPANEVQRWAEIQADRFQNLVLRGFHTELESVYEEKNISLTDDESKALDALMEKLYPSHSYGTQTTIGTQDHLKNPSLVAITNYYNKYYKPNNIAICMSGDINPDEVMAILEKEFGAWEPGNDIAPRSFPAQPCFTAPKDTTVVGPEQESVLLGWRFNGSSTLQCDTLELVNSILMNGKAGLVDLNLNQKMLTQGAFCMNLALKDYCTLLLGGYPKEGQSLDDVRALLLEEIAKLKRGEFDDELITSIVNNKRRDYLQNMEDNESRVYIMYNAFINNKTWDYQVNQINRMQKISKADIISFANRFLNDGYVCSYKKKGEDLNIKKIDKPEITPIPTNRDKSSAFLTELTSRKVGDISPVFVDFQRDIKQSLIKKSIPLYYVKNTDNDLFTLAFRYEFGDRNDVRYSDMAEYFQLLGTSRLSNEEIKKKFYNLACDYSINFGNREITIWLSGLNENINQALKLLDEVLNDTKADTEKYNDFVESVLKDRQERKQDQRRCFNYLVEYAIHGPKNDYTNIQTEEALRNTNPQVYVDLLSGLKEFKHSILYYGPMDEKAFSKMIIHNHSMSKHLKDVPSPVEYEWVKTTSPEIIIAPYKANNIYMRMINNELLPFSKSSLPMITLFNEYFGGGMNAIVFQELRESRGLAYNAWARYVSPSRKLEPAYWMQHIISQNDKMLDCINTFKEITDDMPKVDAALDIAKQSIMKSIASSRITKFSIIDTFFKCKYLGLDDVVEKEIYSVVPTITLNNLTQFEETYIKNKPLKYVILGDESQLDIPALEKIAPIRRVSLEEIFGY